MWWDIVSKATRRLLSVIRFLLNAAAINSWYRILPSQNGIHEIYIQTVTGHLSEPFTATTHRRPSRSVLILSPPFFHHESEVTLHYYIPHPQPAYTPSSTPPLPNNSKPTGVSEVHVIDDCLQVLLRNGIVLDPENALHVLDGYLARVLRIKLLELISKLYDTVTPTGNVMKCELNTCG